MTATKEAQLNGAAVVDLLSHVILDFMGWQRRRRARPVFPSSNSLLPRAIQAARGKPEPSTRPVAPHEFAAIPAAYRPFPESREDPSVPTSYQVPELPLKFRGYSVRPPNLRALRIQGSRPSFRNFFQRLREGMDGLAHLNGQMGAVPRPPEPIQEFAKQGVTDCD